MATATLTSKGQVTIPQAIRDHLHLKSGDRLEFLLQEDGLVVLMPATLDVADLEGILPPPPQSVSLEAMREAIRHRGGKP
ncbi:MAG: AbrB/MazE/SpoVT family DNA-binding domain-containing protein [Candidatus Tectomicrobia bacterium]|nr:AbrB/MazE/SpoVT family DNA-binding domain-containing protein [Candidatus Tectomicrobia bacterium]